MITELYQAIAQTAKSVDNKHVYLEDVPQGFKMPAWLINIIGQNPARGINGRRHNLVQVDVAYIPDDKNTEKVETCSRMGEALSRYDMMGDFHVSNRNISITDNVLHFTFNVNYTELLTISDAKMQTLEQDLNSKEE